MTISSKLGYGNNINSFKEFDNNIMNPTTDNYLVKNNIM